MVNEFHFIQIICDACANTVDVDIERSDLDIVGDFDISKKLPVGWRTIGGNYDNLRCPKCAAKEYDEPQPNIGDKVICLINHKQRNLKCFHEYVVDDVSHTQLRNDKYYKAIYVKTENGGISVMFMGEYTNKEF